jgi:hypothetical protein
MARPERNNVDYFPHPVIHGRKMFYLRTKFKNDGYAIWFMLLEQLGKADFHFLDLADEVQLMFLSSEFMIPENIIIEVINILAKFDEFDQDLWKEKIVFSQKFVDSIKDAYERRNNNVVQKHDLCTTLINKGRLKTTFLQIKIDNKSYSKVKDTKVKDSIPPKIEDVKKYCEERNNNVDTNKWYNHYQAKGWMIGKNRMKDWKASVRTWENSEIKPEKIITDSRTLYPEWKKSQ